MPKKSHQVSAYTARRTSTGRLLTRARERKRLSQQEIADRLGRCRGNIMHIETGRRGLPGHDVLAVARAYGCPPLALLRALERDWRARGGEAA